MLTAQKLPVPLILLLGIVICQPGCAKKWTPEAAREEAFRNIELRIDSAVYPSRDPDFEENRKALKEGKQLIGDRFVTWGSPEPAKGYLVSNLNEGMLPRITRYYRIDGNLDSVRFFSGPKYPRAAYVYCAGRECVNMGKKYSAGELMFVSFHVSDKEVFYFLPDGRLTDHLKN